MKGLRTRFGRFSPDGREYVITTPRTPRPWINVISNGEYGTVVSQTGSGYSWRTHAQLNRLTRWEQDLVRDDWGKYVYLRDDRGEVWSAGWKPVCVRPERYRCRHGIGYTVIESSNHGIDTALTTFVAAEDPVEVWILRMRNRSRRRRVIDLYTYLEWGLGQAPDWHREFHKSFITTTYDSRSGAVMATKRLWEVPAERGHWNTQWPYVAFHSASSHPLSFDTDKESFLGPYGHPAAPHGVSGKKLARRTGKGLDHCASLHHRMRIAPNDETVVVYVLGCADSEAHARALAARYRTPAKAEAALAAVSARWDALLDTMKVATPDPAMDLMENVWLKYQAISGRMWGRSAYYQTGGAYGFRDQLQDSMLWLSVDPVRTRSQLLLHARHQFADGTVYHWWHPLTETGLQNRISDNLLWLPYVLHAYLEETADDAILDVQEPFADDPSGATLYEHGARAIEKALERFSPRGLPLIGEGDWNDGLSAVGLDGRGESVWLGQFLHRILIDFAGIAARRDDSGRSDRYGARAAALREALNTAAWDGGYYFGATKDTGEVLGGAGCREGTVWLNPQTWAVIGGVADRERAEQVFTVVEQKLEKDIGPLLLSPAYRTPDEHIGYLTRYSPGMRENGGVYTHAATWTVIAAAMLGKGSAAHRIYAKINPVNRSTDPRRYCAEPYATAGNIEGPDSPFFGRGGWTWYTGSAAWLYRVGLEWILGIRPTREGLLIDPCIPPSWKSFRVQRRFRGAVYDIEVRNPSRREYGVAEVYIDGKLHGESLAPRAKILPVFSSGERHSVVVVMGGE
ncbi:MAG: glycosyl transferase family 36 [Bacteroidota bacterium]